MHRYAPKYTTLSGKETIRARKVSICYFHGFANITDWFLLMFGSSWHSFACYLTLAFFVIIFGWFLSVIFTILWYILKIMDCIVISIISRKTGNQVSWYPIKRLFITKYKSKSYDVFGILCCITTVWCCYLIRVQLDRWVLK